MAGECRRCCVKCTPAFEALTSSRGIAVVLWTFGDSKIGEETLLELVGVSLSVFSDFGGC